MAFVDTMVTGNGVFSSIQGKHHTVAEGSIWEMRWVVCAVREQIQIALWAPEQDLWTLKQLRWNVIQDCLWAFLVHCCCFLTFFLENSETFFLPCFQIWAKSMQFL